MKKYLFAVILILSCLFLISCGSDKSDEKEIQNKQYEISTIEIFKDYDILKNDTNIELGEYKGFTLNISKKEVTDEDVEKELEYIIKNNNYYKKILDGTVKSGDKVNISFKGYIDGQTFEGGSAESVEINIGEGNFIDGFEESLINKEVGTIVTANTLFPEDYGVDHLNGKEAVFEITINYICGEKTEPSLTDEFIKEYTEYESLDSYKKYVKDYLEEFYENDFLENKDDYYWNAIEEAILNTCKVKSLKKEEVYDYYEGLVSYYLSYANSFGYAMETFCQTFFNMTEEEFKKEMAKMSIDYISFTSIIKEIAKKEFISISDEEYNDYLEDIVNEFEYNSKDELIQELQENNEEENFKEEILIKKVIDFIKKSSNIKE